MIDRVLARHEWQPRAEAHRVRVDDFTAGHRERARRGQNHPVWDFLFSYYSLRPRQLRVWHPGFGIALSGAGGYLERHGYVEVDQGATVDPDYLRARAQTVRFIAGLLGSTASRTPRFSCFGMHEWAMVYRTDEVRHTGLPLRLGAAGTNAVLESMPLRCSHFDAYRFFTPAAAGRNTEGLTRAGQAGSEQPGCLHTNMDLYKWCYKLGPLIDSELLVDCLELAAEARELDMRAGPYDLREYGFDPITVEETAGRGEYVRRQNAIAERAAPLRAALLRRCDALLARCGEPAATSG